MLIQPTVHQEYHIEVENKTDNSCQRGDYCSRGFVEQQFKKVTAELREKNDTSQQWVVKVYKFDQVVETVTF